MGRSGCGMPRPGCRLAHRLCTAVRCNRWRLIPTTGGLRRRAPTGWHDAGVCRAPIAGDVEQIACWVRVETELEFDEGDAIHRQDQLADLGPSPALARAGWYRPSSDAIWRL